MWYTRGIKFILRCTRGLGGVFATQQCANRIAFQAADGEYPTGGSVNGGYRRIVFDVRFREGRVDAGDAFPLLRQRQYGIDVGRGDIDQAADLADPAIAVPD